jgi:PAS domain S-box-containing protein
MVEISRKSPQHPFPWWMWILPLFVGFAADALTFSVSPYPSKLVIIYSVPFGLVLISWFGPRILPGMYAGFTLGTLLWLHPPLGVLFLCRLPDVLAIWLYWFLFFHIRQGDYVFRDTKSVLNFVVWGLILPALPSFLVPFLLDRFQAFPVQPDLLADVLSGAIASVYGTFIITIPILYFFRPQKDLQQFRIRLNEDFYDLYGQSRISRKDLYEILFIYSLMTMAALLPSRFLMDYFFMFATVFMLWASIRFGFYMVLVANIYMFLCYYYGSWLINGIENGVFCSQARQYYTNRAAFLAFSLAGILMGRIISDLKEALIREHDSTEKMRESEERYRYLVEQASEAIFERDAEDYVISVNRKAEEMTGYNRGELLRMKLSSLFTPESLKVSPLRFDLLDQGNTVTEMRNMTRQSGETFVVEMVSRKMENGRYQTIMRDVTERIKVEEDLHEYQQRLELIFKINPAVMSISTLHEGRFLSVNPAFSKMTGYAVEEMVGHTSAELQLWADKNQRETLIKSLKAPSQIVTAVVKVRCKSGKIVSVLASFTVIKIKNVDYSLIVGMDISDRIRMENELRTKEEKISALLHLIPDSICRIHRDGTILERKIDASAAQSLGIDGSEPQEIFQLIPQRDDRLQAAEIIDRVMRTRQSLSFSFSVHSDKRRFFEVLVTPASNEECVCIIRDMTDRQRMEEELMKSAKLESLSLLAGGIAHDFNNLLAGLFGYVEIAREFLQQGETAKAQSNLDKIPGIFERAKNLTSQLLSYAKGGEPVRTVVDIAQIVHDATTFILSGTSLKPEFRFSDQNLLCEVDPNQISQVVDNIVLNSVQAVPAGGKLIVNVERLESENGLPPQLKPVPHVKISFRDFGPGIPPEIKSKIFDPFFSTKKDGSGLGLSTAYSIVKKHGGYIEVNSEPGQGSEFVIFLPVGNDKNRTPKPGKSEIRGRGNILIMDDEEFMRNLISTSLSSMGFSVETARDGEHAVEKYESYRKKGRPFDVVILDLVVVNGMGGVLALQELRKRDPDVLIIASSGYADDPIIADPLSFGFDAALSKPYRARDLGALLNRLMREKIEKGSLSNH